MPGPGWAHTQSSPVVEAPPPPVVQNRRCPACVVEWCGPPGCWICGESGEAGLFPGIRAMAHGPNYANPGPEPENLEPLVPVAGV